MSNKTRSFKAFELPKIRYEDRHTGLRGISNKRNLFYLGNTISLFLLTTVIFLIRLELIDILDANNKFLFDKKLICSIKKLDLNFIFIVPIFL